ncbi:hypothetical protein [Salibacterium qingdaonense]|uniref:ParE toxin of type II toxin-antitoxin system, parDE n=1 Tax=Salibacterium qingdaonense TaxID=266892 RepID=A0A1I4LQ60_9BACI|nr:hypothetical protein [Salibacterium qingdaonense]SFL92953.1 hypothetical protein SAMN04488054_10891 [Salibacterium qingdaonense]
MEIKWAKQAFRGFNDIHSSHFTPGETKEYKKYIVKRIKEKIGLLGTSIPADHLMWEGSYKVIVDKYVMYYSFSADKKTCYTEHLFLFTLSPKPDDRSPF